MEFAQLVGTTRRTLIFYEQEGIFQPARISQSGYRYYDYDQIYNFEIISSLRQSGLTINQIKAILSEPDPSKLLIELQDALNQLADKSAQLQRSITAVKNRINLLKSNDNALPINEPRLVAMSAQRFWCSDTVDACAPAEMAQQYSAFSKRLTQQKIIVADNGGFITNLALPKYNEYAHASFRFIHTLHESNQQVLPQITKPAGQYLVVKTHNDNHNIIANLGRLAHFCKERHLITAPALWQFNTDMNVQTLGSSSDGILQYQIIGKED